LCGFEASKNWSCGTQVAADSTAGAYGLGLDDVDDVLAGTYEPPERLEEPGTLGEYSREWAARFGITETP
jgi:hypothetical protein